MLRKIVGFDRDAENHWRAALLCGHFQHVRHAPPLVVREWVLTEHGREAKLGAELDCKICENNIEGFVLAGGASSRMGQSKAFLQLGGKTFLERAADALRRVGGEKVAVVGAGDFSSAHLPVVPDVFAVDGTRAAIFGLHSALIHAEKNWAAVLACDLPFASGELFERLAQFRGDFDAVVPLQPDGRAQPLCALYRRENCLAEIQATLDGGDDWRVQGFLRKIKTNFVEFPNFADLPDSADFFFNVNTPEDYQKAKNFVYSKP